MAKNTKIVVSKNGPYLVSGGLPLDKQEVVCDADGNPLKWKQVAKLSAPENCALCRCGKSKSKPYCDYAHVKANFDGTETASKEKYENRAMAIKRPDLVLTDVEDLCTGAGFCHRAGGTWQLTKESADPEKKKLAIQEACDCPSGRLVAWENGKPIEPKFEPHITLVEEPAKGVSGPLWVKGGVQIESADGKQYEKRNRVTLCRCGKSENKPFCDGTHVSIGFDDGV
jgi:CDGSH-type Zn-finger protein